VSKAHDDVMKMIAKRQRKNAAFNKKAAELMGVNAIVLEFIDAMEKASKDSKSGFEFNDAMNRASRVLSERMKRLDGGATLEVIWNQTEVKNETWRDLTAEGIRVVWSDDYIARNPSVNKETHIDVGSLFIEGFLG
jgi:hypothetical protein